MTVMTREMLIEMSKCGIDESAFAKPEHPMFAELAAIDKDFNEFYGRVRRIDQQVLLRGSRTINVYIDAITKYKDQITPEMLVSPYNRFCRHIDPVFAFLIRGICGPEMITDQVFEKVRKAWCGDDIPLSVGEILKTKDNNRFLSQFNAAYFSPTENVKLTILRQMDVMPRLLSGSFNS